MLQSTGARPGSIFLPLGHILMACWSWRMAAVFSGGLIDRLAGVVNALFHLQQSAGSVSAACFPLSSSITPSPLMHTCSVPLSWLPSYTFRFDNNLLTYFFKKDLKCIKSHHWGVRPLVKIKHCMRMQAVFHAFLPKFSRASINCIQCFPFFRCTFGSEESTLKGVEHLISSSFLSTVASSVKALSVCVSKPNA